MPAKVATIEYDPNRSAYIALLNYADGEKRYILAPQGLRGRRRGRSGEGADIAPGNSLPLSRIPTGTVVHNVELVPGQGGRLGRAAGHRDSGGGQGGRDGLAAPALVGGADGARRVPRDRRLAFQHRASERQGGARPAAAATAASARRRAASR